MTGLLGYDLLVRRAMPEPPPLIATVSVTGLLGYDLLAIGPAAHRGIYRVSVTGLLGYDLLEAATRDSSRLVRFQ